MKRKANPSLILVNPRRRKKRAHKARRRRASRRRVHHRARRRRARVVVLPNPHRRRSHRRRNPHRRHYSRRRRNPFSLGGGMPAVQSTLTRGSWGALGALGNDAIFGLAAPYLPTMITGTPLILAATKILSAVVTGWLGGKLFRGRGAELAVGAATVAIHDTAKGLLEGMAPAIFGPGGTLPLGAYLSDGTSGLGGAAPLVGTQSYPQQPWLTTSGFVGPGVGAYLSGSDGSYDSGVYNGDRMGIDNWDASGYVTSD